MFDELSSKLNATLQKLTGRGVLTEDAVKEGLREIRRILLEADVSFDLTRDFLERVQAKAVGLASLKEVRPGHQLVKIVYDELVALLGEKQAPIAHATVPPTIILLVGLQGSGKTTTAGKLAKRLKLEQKAPFLVAADVYRPAAIEQLHTLGQQVEVGVYGETGSQGGSSSRATSFRWWRRPRSRSTRRRPSGWPGRSPPRRGWTWRTSSAPCGRCRRWGRSRMCWACCRE